MPHFALSGPDDRHFRIDAYAGEVQFGPALRGIGGGLLSHGAVPPSGAVLRLDAYRTGGGQAGNVARGPGARTQDEHPVRVPGGEPVAGDRWCRGRDSG